MHSTTAQAAPAGAAGVGLVPYAITSRRFPTTDLVAAAASLFDARTRPDLSGGAHSLGTVLSIAPGVVSIGKHGYAVRPAQPGVTERAEIRAWSRKSRARMVRRLGELDYAPLFAGPEPAMVTLTCPGDWLAVAPDAATLKRAFSRFLRRLRVWNDGKEVPLVWKLEFQRRGAPHFHLFMAIPHGQRACRCRLCPRRKGPWSRQLGFREWLSHAWAECLNHPDPAQYMAGVKAGTGVDFREGTKMTDPRRLAVYFAKHGGAGGGKEYQHRVPDEWENAPGRFWGYKVLRPVVSTVILDAEDAVWAARTLRRWSARRVYRHSNQRWPHRVEKAAPRLTWGAGFVMPADGPVLASQLSRFLDLRRVGPAVVAGQDRPVVALPAQ